MRGDSIRIRILGLIALERPAFIALFNEAPRFYDFSQLKPRGHYTQSEELKRYFQAMMWFGRTELRLTEPPGLPATPDVTREIIDAFLLRELAATEGRTHLENIDRIIRALVGASDNITLDEMDRLTETIGIRAVDELLDAQVMAAFRSGLATGRYAAQAINSQILVSDATHAAEERSRHENGGPRHSEKRAKESTPRHRLPPPPIREGQNDHRGHRHDRGRHTGHDVLHGDERERDSQKGPEDRTQESPLQRRRVLERRDESTPEPGRREDRRKADDAGEHSNLVGGERVVATHSHLAEHETHGLPESTAGREEHSTRRRKTASLHGIRHPLAHDPHDSTDRHGDPEPLARTESFPEDEPTDPGREKRHERHDENGEP
jgi:hypothetical protein